MRQFRKIALFTVLALAAVGATAMALDNILKSEGGLGSLASALEAMKIKRMKPGMPPEAVKRQAELAPKGVLGLLQGLTSSESLTMNRDDAANSGSKSGANSKEVYISVRENPNAILERQTNPDNADGTGVKGVVQNVDQRRTVEVSQTKDGRDAIAVINDPSVHDFSDVDRIMAMNIPEDLRAKILKNYQETGVLPEILVREKSKRKPSSDAADLDSDDPYNKSNW